MGTRRRDAERRPVSLAIEALEDRFMLSGAAALSAPTSAHEPSTVRAAAPNSDTRNATAVLPQAISTMNAKATIGSNSVPFFFPFLINPLGYQLDADGDEEVPIRGDADASHNSASALPLPLDCNDAAGGPNVAPSYRAREQLTVPAASPLSFLPSLSASGLGVMATASLPWIFPATAIPRIAREDHVPPGKDEGRLPMPEAPEALPATLPPLAEEFAEPAPPSSPRGPLTERLSLDLEALQQGVDAFFQQLSLLSEQWSASRLPEKLAPWLLATSVAGYGWVRFRNRGERRFAELAGPEGFIAPTIFLPGEEG